MKGKRLLILGAAFALGLSACANANVYLRKENPLKANTTGTFEKTAITDLAEGDTIVIVGTNSTSSYALYNANGTASAPTASAVNISNNTITDPDENIVWTFGFDGDNYVFYKEKAKTNWLYCTAANNGIRVGTNANKSFTIEGGYLKHIATSRYVGIYNNQDWRCYTSTSTNISGQSFNFYKKAASSIPQLDKPQPVHSNGVITWGAVDNASSYNVSIDGGNVVNVTTTSYTLGTLSSPAAHTATVVAVGDGTSYSNSDAGSVAFALLTKAGTLQQPYDVANVIAAVDGNGPVSNVYAAGIISQIDSYYANGKSINYWISDDGKTDNQIKIYGGKGLNGADFASTEDIVVGASVVIVGNLVKFNTIYEFDSNSEQVSYQVPQRVLTSITLSGSYPKSFYKGDDFSSDGLIVTAHYNDNSTQVVTSHATLAGYDMNVADNQTVTVSYTENDVPATATYSISVTVPSVADSVEFIAGTDKGSYTATGTYTDIVRKGGIILTGTDTPLGNDDNYRIYKGKTLTISIYSGSEKAIKSIEFTCTANGTNKYGPGCFAEQDGYSYSGNTGTWSGNAKAVSFTASSEQVRATSIVVTTGTDGVPTTEEKINAINTRASLSYSFEKEQTVVSDVINYDSIGVEGTTYTDWSGKSGTSGAVYAGQSAGGNEAIQLRSDKNSAGIITTTSAGKLAKVIVSWNSNTANSRKIDIYGKNTAYTSASDLYGDDAGTKLGSIVNGTSTELLITGDYSYVGIRSSSGALYLDSVEIQWGEPATYEFSRVALIVGGFISQDLWNELNGGENGTNIKGYGVIGAFTENLDKSIQELYNDGLNAGHDIDVIIDDDVCDGVNVRNFYTPLTASKLHPAEADDTQKTEQQVDVDDTYYVWSLRKNISDYNKAFSAIAYIRLEDKLVFFKEVSTTAKQAGQDLIDKGIYNGSAFDGSLGYFLDNM